MAGRPDICMYVLNNVCLDSVSMDDTNNDNTNDANVELSFSGTSDSNSRVPDQFHTISDLDTFKGRFVLVVPITVTVTMTIAIHGER